MTRDIVPHSWVAQSIQPNPEDFQGIGIHSFLGLCQETHSSASEHPDGVPACCTSSRPLHLSVFRSWMLEGPPQGFLHLRATERTGTACRQLPIPSHQQHSPWGTPSGSRLPVLLKGTVRAERQLCRAGMALLPPHH